MCFSACIALIIKYITSEPLPVRSCVIKYQAFVYSVLHVEQGHVCVPAHTTPPGPKTLLRLQSLCCLNDIPAMWLHVCSMSSAAQRRNCFHVSEIPTRSTHLFTKGCLFIMHMMGGGGCCFRHIELDEAKSEAEI